MAVVSTRTPSASDEVRIVPVRHNWGSAYRVSLEFKTDIITSGNGREQRRAVRELPRHTIDITADLTPAEKFCASMLAVRSFAIAASDCGPPTASHMAIALLIACSSWTLMFSTSDAAD